MAFAGASLAALAGGVWQARCEGAEMTAYPPPGDLIDVGGHRLHLYARGHGSPTVIFESGLGCTYLDWTRVQESVASFTMTCSYDRAGRGYSDTGRRPRTAPRIARELGELLSHADVAPPFILVGHSMGGIYARAFANAYRKDVAGIVLVDASHEDQRARWPERDRPRLWELVQEFTRARRPLLARLGVLRLLNHAWVSPRGMPDDKRAAERALGLRSRAYDWMLDEYAAARESERAVRGTDLGDLPLAVVTASQTEDLSDEVYGEWMAMQQSLCALSSDCAHFVSAWSGHVIPLEDPDLIVEAIRWVIGRSNGSAD